MRKGIALPMETIVIIAIVVIVLIVIMAFFIASAGSGAGGIRAQEVLGKGCTELSLRFGCKASEIPKVNIPGYEGGLAKACRDNGYTTDEQCAQIGCRCPPAG